MSLIDFGLLDPDEPIFESYLKPSSAVSSGEYMFRVSYRFYDPITNDIRNGSLAVLSSPKLAALGENYSKHDLEKYLFDIVKNDRLGVSDIRVVRGSMHITGAYKG